MLDNLLELFTDARNEAAILVHHQQAQIILVKKGYWSLFGMNGNGRHRSNAHPSGGLPHRRKHLKRMGTQRDEVNRFRHIVRGENHSAMCEDTGLYTWKSSTEFDHAIDRQHLLGHEDRLESILIDSLDPAGGRMRALSFKKHCFRDLGRSVLRRSCGGHHRLLRRFGEI
jgi:hypothetical protein